MKQKRLHKFFLTASLLLGVLVPALLLTTCSDKDTFEEGQQYGYVQFRVLKGVPEQLAETRAAVDKLERLGDAKKS
jgi:hypothetical protein